MRCPLRAAGLGRSRWSSGAWRWGRKSGLGLALQAAESAVACLPSSPLRKAPGLGAPRLSGGALGASLGAQCRDDVLTTGNSEGTTQAGSQWGSAPEEAAKRVLGCGGAALGADNPTPRGSGPGPAAPCWGRTRALGTQQPHQDPPYSWEGSASPSSHALFTSGVPVNWREPFHCVHGEASRAFSAPLEVIGEPHFCSPDS